MSNHSLQTVSTSGDKLKVVLAVVAVMAGLVGFYFLSDKSVLVRTGVLAVGLVVGVIFVWMSSTGRGLLSFAQESLRETKKVVWPERKQTLRVTAIVFGFVLVMALFLWGADKVLGFVLYSVILGWR